MLPAVAKEYAPGEKAFVMAGNLITGRASHYETEKENYLPALALLRESASKGYIETPFMLCSLYMLRGDDLEDAFPERFGLMKQSYTWCGVAARVAPGDERVTAKKYHSSMENVLLPDAPETHGALENLVDEAISSFCTAVNEHQTDVEC